MKGRKNTVLFIIFTVMSLFCMVMIFLFSFQTGLESAENSTGFYELFLKITGFDFISHNMFRKAAHFTEYCALGFFSAGSYYYLGLFSYRFLGGATAFLYSMSDEFHQYFVPERACRIYDVYIDTAGIIFGIFLFSILIRIIYKIFKKDCS